MSTLVIVESPGKIKKIKSILGDGYIVLASQGHIRDLDPSNLSIDVNNNFTPNYIINSDKKGLVTNLKKTYSNCNNIIIASDGDREGESIGYHLLEVLKPKKYSRIIDIYPIKQDTTNSLLSINLPSGVKTIIK